MAHSIIVSWLKEHRTLATFLALLLGSFMLFSWLKQEPAFFDGDPFYHAKMAQLMIEQRGIVKEFPWMPGSILEQHFYDHHFLYHALLVPFVLAVGDPLLAVRLAMVLFGALFIACFYLFLKKLRGAMPAAFALLLLASPSFISRINFDKAPAVSLLVLFAGLYALLARKPVVLFIISFAYVWLYDAWPLLVVAVLLWCVSESAAFALQTFDGSVKHFFRVALKGCLAKWRIKLVAACGLGITAGIVINPYFPDNISFYKIHLISIALVTKGVAFGIGQEWFPIGALPLMRSNLLFFTLWLCALSWTIIQICSALRAMQLPSEVRTPSSTSGPALFFGIFSILLFLYTLKSQRMAEYLIPIGAIFASLSLRDIFSALTLPYMKEFFSCIANARYLPAKIIFSIFALFGAATLLNTGVTDYEDFRSSAARADSYGFNSMQSVGAFMRSHLPARAIVATDDWSYFPQLLYYADNQRYLWGLDPTYTHDIDPKKYDTLRAIMRGENNETAALTLAKDFGASYLLVGKRDDAHFAPLQYISRYGGFEKIYDDHQATLYAIR